MTIKAALEMKRSKYQPGKRLAIECRRTRFFIRGSSQLLRLDLDLNSPNAHPQPRPSPSPPTPDQIRATYVAVDIDAVLANVDTIRAGRRGHFFAAVVKADAYGHGALPVARRLSEERVVDALVVSLVEEALELRAAGIELPILVAPGSFTNAHELIVRHSLTPVVGTSHDLERFSQVGQALEKTVSLHLEIDVGMARLGFPLQSIPQLRTLATTLPNIQVTGVMAHPSHTEDCKTPRTVEQNNMLLEAATALAAPVQDAINSPAKPCLHILTSGAMASLDGATIDATDLYRVGLAIYGIQPVPSKPIAGLLPALSWFSCIVALRTVDVGCQVGYNGTWTAGQASVIATLGVGYADGYPRSLSNRGQVHIGGQRASIVGSLCEQRREWWQRRRLTRSPSSQAWTLPWSMSPTSPVYRWAMWPR